VSAAVRVFREIEHVAVSVGVEGSR